MTPLAMDRRSPHGEISDDSPEKAFTAYRETQQEKARAADLLSLLPEGRQSVLDAGARDGHFSRLLAAKFARVTALDLAPPVRNRRDIAWVRGNLVQLPFASASFDTVFCAEVLEHIPNLRQACKEIERVARHEVLIGVPFRQDLRLGRMSCHACGYVSPPWGHLHSFDREELSSLFPNMTISKESYVGRSAGATNWIATGLMDFGGNPWGTYGFGATCLKCGQLLRTPEGRGTAKRACAYVASLINRFQTALSPDRPLFMHILLTKVV